MYHNVATQKDFFFKWKVTYMDKISVKLNIIRKCLKTSQLLL